MCKYEYDYDNNNNFNYLYWRQLYKYNNKKAFVALQRHICSMNIIILIIIMIACWLGPSALLHLT